jgi:hypothetical protein
MITARKDQHQDDRSTQGSRWVLEDIPNGALRAFMRATLPDLGAWVNQA